MEEDDEMRDEVSASSESSSAVRRASWVDAKEGMSTGLREAMMRCDGEEERGRWRKWSCEG